MKKHTTCNCCNGTGQLEEDVCIADFAIPETHEMADKLEAIKQDALKAKTDHGRLCEMIPRARESYDAQLVSVLEKLNAQAESIF